MKSLTSIVLPTGDGTAVSAGMYLFDGCVNLTSVTFPQSGWTKLVFYMFRNCTSLESIAYPRYRDDFRYICL